MRKKVVSLLVLGIMLTGLSRESMAERVMKAGEIRKVENPHSEEAARFPGNVDLDVPRLADVVVKIDGKYDVNVDGQQMSRIAVPWIRTGLYVAPGEMITVDVPEGTGKVEYRITAYHCRLNPEKVKNLKRFPDVRKFGGLHPGRNEISSDFGGHLYILFPDGAPGERLKFKISGAVKSPDYVLGQTNPKAWLKEIAVSRIPWGEMVSDRIIFTLPLASMQKVKDPQEMMKFYKEMVDLDFDGYNGFDNKDSNPVHHCPAQPWRFVFDVQLCAGAAHAGYPIACSYYWANRAVDLDLIRNDGRAWGFYHELGHNYQTWCWKWGTLGEVSCNFPIFYARTRTGRWPGKVDDFQKMIDELVNKDFEGKDFDADPFSHGSRIVPFIQLAQEYGWELFRYLARESRELTADKIAELKKAGNEGRRNYFCRKTAEFAKTDLRPFFDAWGIKYDGGTATFMAAYSQPGKIFWKKFDVNKFPAF